MTASFRQNNVAAQGLQAGDVLAVLFIADAIRHHSGLIDAAPELAGLHGFEGGAVRRRGRGC